MPAFRLFRPDEPPAAQPSLTVRDVLDAYLRHSRANGVHGPAALEDRERTFGLFAEAHGGVAVVDARPWMLSDFVESHAGWRSVSTRRARANAIKAAFAWAADGERIGRNPFRKVAYAEAERRPDMPDDVLGKVEALANKPFEAALRWLRLTGCRLSELCNATWGQMDLDRGVWVIQRHKGRRYSGKPRVVVLVPEAVALLRGIPFTGAAGGDAGAVSGTVPGANMPANASVFLNTRGRPWTRRTLGQQLARMKKRHGIATPASLHGIRHRAGTAMIANGAPLKLASAQLGHATTTITERYYCDLTNEIEAIRDAASKGVPK